MMNLDLIFPEIFLSLAIMLLLMIGVFKKNSERLVYNLTTITLLILLALIVNLFSVSETLIFNESYKIDSFCVCSIPEVDVILAFSFPIITPPVFLHISFAESFIYIFLILG